MAVSTEDMALVTTFLQNNTLNSVEIERDGNQQWTRFTAQAAGGISYTLTVFDDPAVDAEYAEHRTRTNTTVGQMENIGGFDEVDVILKRTI